jgi:chloride channel 3/4/5
MELIPFAALGIFGGLLGSLFIWFDIEHNKLSNIIFPIPIPRANIKWCAYRKGANWLGQNPIYEVLIVSAVTGAISFFNPYTRKSASSLIKQVCI